MNREFFEALKLTLKIFFQSPAKSSGNFIQTFRNIPMVSTYIKCIKCLQVSHVSSRFPFIQFNQWQIYFKQKVINKDTLDLIRKALFFSLKKLYIHMYKCTKNSKDPFSKLHNWKSLLSRCNFKLLNWYYITF